MNKKLLIKVLFIKRSMQILTSIFLIVIGLKKFFSDMNATDVYIFTKLGMEPQGRVIIAIIETLSGIFMLTTILPAVGALLALGVMLGAIIAHTTVLGLSIQGDNGLHVLMLLFVFINSLYVTYDKRRQIPFIGDTF